MNEPRLTNGAAATPPAVVDDRAEALARAVRGDKRRSRGRFLLAALSSIPWVGGFMSAVAALDAEKEQAGVNELQRQWMEEHGEKLKALGVELEEILRRLDALNAPEVEERLDSAEYLGLVKKGFRVWDQSDTKEKRKIVRDLLTNAAASRIVSDDVVRLFLDWIERYHEIHFAVIRYVFAHPGATRGAMWSAISSTQPRDDSAEADLFRLLIDDLSRGRVIRQDRQTNSQGQFLTKRRAPAARDGVGHRVHKSAFDDNDEYELSELGKQFVHYCMNEVVPRIG